MHHEIETRASTNAGLNPRTWRASHFATHSNWYVQQTQSPNGVINGADGNQATKPVFVNAAAGDYRQAPGSPTIDAGLEAPINGAFDVDGDTRTLGNTDVGAGTTDIGADEFVFAPAATTGPP